MGIKRPSLLRCQRRQRSHQSGDDARNGQVRQPANENLRLLSLSLNTGNTPYLLAAIASKGSGLTDTSTDGA